MPEKFESTVEFSPGKGKPGKESYWEIKRREILEGLDRRVGILINFEKEVDSLTSEDPPEKVEDTLRGFVERTKSSFPQEVQDKLGEYKRLNEEVDKLYVKRKKMEEEGIGSKRWYEAHEVLEKEQDLDNRMAKIREDNNIVLLLNLEESTEKLIGKNRYVKSIQKNKDMLHKELSGTIHRWFKEDFEPTKIDDIIFDPFCINVVLDESYFVKLYKEKGVAGIHLSHTPFNLIKGGETEIMLKRTIEHEKTHNLADTVYEISGSGYAERLITRIRDYKKDVQGNDAEILLKSKKETLIKRMKSRFFVDDFHKEILSDIMAGRLMLETGEKDNLLTRISEGIGLALAFSGSWGRLNRITDIIDEEARGITDTEIHRSLKEFKRKFRIRLATLILGIKELVDISKELGPQAEKEVHFLFFLLKPSRYRHIRSHLEFKYSSEKYIQALEITKGIRKFNLKSLERITDSDKLTEANKRIVGEVIAQGCDFDIKKYGISSIEDLRKFRQLIGKWGKDLEIPEKAGDFNDLLSYNFFFIAIERDLKNNLQNLPKLCEQLTDEEKKKFRETLEDYLQPRRGYRFIYKDWERIFKEPFDFKKFKKTPAWRVISDFGLAEVTEAMYKREEKKKPKRSK